MTRWQRDELEQAFRAYWQAGAVGEDWDAWANRFTEDAVYVEHVLGNMHGREAIRAWIKPIMAQFGEIYTAYEWHTVDEASGRVCVYMQNRRDHPSGKGTIDFPGITILEYGGNGLWKKEEDFWAVPGAQSAGAEYAKACKEFDPDHKVKQTRRDWGNGPAWTRGAATYAERASVSAGR
ncbi:MAG TPA: nuclear transport factor 2 family protein [Candidatus Binatia bacterium]|jgi:ketosteroid isomerase-like protein|nr:nuclear transport factor 2 family protein [Candidatus Binatia bacterium]